MAEVIGVASGVSALVVTTLHGILILQQTIKSYEGHQKLVRDFLDELSALTQVLSKLEETIKTVRDVDFSMLEIPLQRSNATCEALYKELLKCLSRSNDSRTSFRDWARLKYSGEDIDGVRRLLAEYKMTISIALAGANLRESFATVEKIEVCTDLLKSTNADLQDRLERIDEKMERLVELQREGSEEDASELKMIEIERLSTKKCLEICAQLSDHISQAQLTAKRTASQDGPVGSSTLPQQMVDEGFQGCVDSLSRANSNLEEHHRKLFDQLVEKSKTAVLSEEDRSDIARLRDECVTTRHNLNIWSTAQVHIKEKISMIENYADGNALQIMASTGDKTIHGKNYGHGAKIGQFGGHMSDDTIQQSLLIMRDMFGAKTEINGSSQERRTMTVPVDGMVAETGSSFKGQGFQLASSPSCTQTNC